MFRYFKVVAEGEFDKHSLEDETPSVPLDIAISQEYDDYGDEGLWTFFSKVSIISNSRPNACCCRY